MRTLPTSASHPLQPRRYSKKLPDDLRTRLLRRSLWESLRTRLLPELLAVCARAVVASEADLPHKDDVMRALARWAVCREHQPCVPPPPAAACAARQRRRC